jgi:precorrin-4/cobalt-precorrin-4 C11-methyltransferase
MKVFFIGAGPGAPDLITLRGARILSEAPVVMYAGSLVSTGMLSHCRPDARILDSASLNLEQQVAEYQRARDLNQNVARLHSGDPAIYGAIAEQMRALDQLEIPYEAVPGVSSFTASAAVLKASLTRPEISQSIVITRTEGRASAVPEGESLASLAAHQATMAIFLSGATLTKTVSELLKFYPRETPAALVCKATWPEEKHHSSTLGALLSEIHPAEWTLSTMLLVGYALGSEPGLASRLYAPDYSHRYRKAVRTSPAASPAEDQPDPPQASTSVVHAG